MPSVTSAVNAKVPVAVGNPVNTPEGHGNPLGSDPAVIAHEYGRTPPTLPWIDRNHSSPARLAMWLKR